MFYTPFHIKIFLVTVKIVADAISVLALIHVKMLHVQDFTCADSSKESVTRKLARLIRNVTHNQ